MNPRVLTIPIVILVGGIVTALTAPVDNALRVMILLGDVCAAVVIGLIQWRRMQ